MVSVLRPLERRDLSELVQLCREHALYERAAWSEFEREDRLEALFLSSAEARCWVLEGQGELAGFASATLERSTWDAGRYLHLDCLYLRADYRGQGQGRALMARVAGAALELGALNLQWQTPAWNLDAVRFYERLGASSAEKLRFTLSPKQCASLAAGDEPALPAAVLEAEAQQRASPRNARLLVLSAATVILLWGSSFVAVKLALVELAPGPLALARYVVASLVFLAMLLVRRCALPAGADLLRLAAAGGIGIALYNLALNSGQRTLSAGVASLLVNTVPIWTSLLSVLLLGEHIQRRAWLGAWVSFFGVALLSLSRGGLQGVELNFFLILGAAISQGLYFVLIKPLLGRYHPIDLTSYVIWFGCVFLSPFHGGLVESLLASSPGTQASVLYLGIGPAALAYLAWAHVLRQLPAGKASNLLFLVPVAAILLGWLLLHEVPTPLAILGGCIAILGVVLGKRSSASKALPLRQP